MTGFRVPLPWRKMPRLSTSWLRTISGGILLLMMMLAAAVPAVLLSTGLLGNAAADERHRLETLGNRLVQALDTLGLPGLLQTIGKMNDAVLIDTDRAEVALWRGADDQRRLVIETRQGLAEALSSVPFQDDAMVRIGNEGLRAVAIDLETLTREWVTPIADLDLRIAFSSPGPELRAARRSVVAVWSGLLFALTVGLLLLFNHRQRYQAALASINAELDRFAAGATDVRVPDNPPAPELAALSGHLNRVLGRLEELIAGLRYLSGTAAHELKTPLQKIKIDLGKLRHAGSEPTVRDAWAAVDQRIDSALATFDAIMLLFRLEAERDELSFWDPVNLSDRAMRHVEDFESLLCAAGHALSADIVPGVFVAGDRRLLDQIFVNLLENARKYAPPESRIEIGLVAQDGRFVLRVANPGSFPDDVRAHAFERFAQSRQIPSTAGGVGLGLSLVRAIAHRHGFTAAISDTTGKAEVVIEGPLFSTGTRSMPAAA